MTYLKLAGEQPSSFANSSSHTKCRISHAVQHLHKFEKLRIMKMVFQQQFSSVKRKNILCHTTSWTSLMPCGNFISQGKILLLLMMILNKYIYNPLITPFFFFFWPVDIKIFLKYVYILKRIYSHSKNNA